MPKVSGTLTALVTSTSPMRRMIKSALLLVVLAICVLGALFSPQQVRRDREPNTNLVPVNNAQPHRKMWLRV
jgi:hypothetical protein